MKVLNKSTNKIEPAQITTCPRCKGFGQLSTEDRACYLCNGHGEVYMAPSGWTRAKWKRVHESQLY
jgi:DnaJ-class molecular chaperone